MRTVSHEFRTPLAVIDNTAAILEHHWQKLDEVGRNAELHQIKAQVLQLTKMLDNVSVHLKADEGQLQPTMDWHNLKTLVLELFDELRGLCKPTHTLVLDAGVHEIYADRGFMRHIMSNLLTNAIKYSPTGGQIIVETSTLESGAVQIKVRDHGIGITAEDMTHLFDAYYRADAVEGIKGTGLGLTITRDFIALMDGNIYVHSIVGEGSTFVVDLPQPESETDKSLNTMP